MSAPRYIAAGHNRFGNLTWFGHIETFDYVRFGAGKFLVQLKIFDAGNRNEP